MNKIDQWDLLPLKVHMHFDIFFYSLDLRSVSYLEMKTCYFTLEASRRLNLMWPSDYNDKRLAKCIGESLNTSSSWKEQQWDKFCGHLSNNTLRLRYVVGFS